MQKQDTVSIHKKHFEAFALIPEDLAFVQEYDISTQPKTIISDIRRYKKIPGQAQCKPWDFSILLKHNRNFRIRSHTAR